MTFSVTTQPRPADLSIIGARFGRLTVTGYEVEVRNGRRFGRYVLRCDCGKETRSFAQALRIGEKKSCGCIHRERRHGQTNTRAYVAWLNMRRRCNDPKHPDYRNYGARGINVSPWWSDFTNFLADMGQPGPGLSLDRINNDGDYCKENCRWTDRSTQNRNRRPSKVV